MPQETASQRMMALLESIASGKIKAAGHKAGDLPSLNNLVLDLSDIPDGTLNSGDTFPFGDKGQATILGVGTEERDGHVYYQVQLRYPQ